MKTKHTLRERIGMLSVREKADFLDEIVAAIGEIPSDSGIVEQAEREVRGRRDLHRCYKCGNYKLRDAFIPNNSRNNGLASKCKACSRTGGQSPTQHIVDRMMARMKGLDRKEKKK